MKDEIKEKIKAYYIGNDIDKVLDYITNLQEENIQLQSLLKVKEYEYEDLCIDNRRLDAYYTQYHNEKEDLQDRIDKAIEYITSEETINMFNSINAREKWLKINHKLLNILNGGDEE